jgi:hypothetical protein
MAVQVALSEKKVFGTYPIKPKPSQLKSSYSVVRKTLSRWSRLHLQP